MFACEDDEFVSFVIECFKCSSVTFELAGVAFSELFENRANRNDDFVDALTHMGMAKRKDLKMELRIACMMVKRTQRKPQSKRGQHWQREWQAQCDVSEEEEFLQLQQRNETERHMKKAPREKDQRCWR